MMRKIVKWDVGQWPSASRRTDPATSKQAEKEINLGPRAKRARQVLNLVNLYPNRTHGELALEMLHHCQVSICVAAETPHKRLPDLESMGLVERGSVRKCRDSGKDCCTWNVTEKGRRELENSGAK